MEEGVCKSGRAGMHEACVGLWACGGLPIPTPLPFAHSAPESVTLLVVGVSFSCRRGLLILPGTRGAALPVQRREGSNVEGVRC